jgi:hypothetical protein
MRLCGGVSEAGAEAGEGQTLGPPGDGASAPGAKSEALLA